MTKQSKCFFDFTREFSNRVGDITSFVWASYCGLWHIHKSGNALASLSSNPEWKKIEDYLVDGVPDRGGIDLHHITSKPWSEHQVAYSEFILTQGAILYEEWCGSLARVTTTPGKKVKAETFQFPSGATSQKYTNWHALDMSPPGIMVESSFLKNEVQPGLVALYASNIANIDALLRWYRFFKELRNSMIHHGGAVRPENIAAYTSAATMSLKTTGMKRDFTGSAPVLGTKIQLSLSDAVLLLGIIQRLAYAFDAKYCHTQLAETTLRNRLKEALVTIYPPIEAKAARKTTWIKNFLSHSGGITPKSLVASEQWLKNSGLVIIKTV